MSARKARTGLVYVTTHPDFRSVKVGCTKTSSNRLSSLLRSGWQTYRYLTAATGQIARQVEQETLFEIRHRLYVPPYLSEAEMPGGGWTETSSLALVSARDVWDLVCEQAARLHLNPTTRAQTMRRPPPHRRTPGDTPSYSRIARTQARLERTPDKTD